MPKNQYSFITFGCISVIYLFAFFQFGMWKSGAKGGDPLGYYTYLPATFIYGDLEQLVQTNSIRGQYLNSPFRENYYEENFIVNKLPNGNKVIKYTCGLALTILPFFAIAHFLAPLLGFSADGFSVIYIFFQYFSGFFYGLLGLWLVRLILLKWFADKWVALSLLFIAVGTNLFFFTTYHSPMAHATLFFLHALAIYLTIQLYENQTWGNAIGLGLTLGLIILIRPVEIFIVAIPIFWGLDRLNKRIFKERIQFFKNHQAKIALIVLSTFLVAIPQFLYWYKLTGQFLFYSYVEEGFDFAKPKIIKGLFSYSNGWLAYTPMLYFALIGIYFIQRKRIGLLSVLLFLLPHIYVTYSWWCWYYINGYGSRPMVETYALLSLPFTAYWVIAYQKKWLFRGSIILAIFFIYLNVFQTWQFYKGLFRPEASKLEFYLSTMFKTQLTQEDLVLYDCGEWQPNREKLQLKNTLYFNGFEKDTTFLGVTQKKRRNGLHAWQMGQPKRWMLFESPIKDLDLEKGDYIQLKFAAWKGAGGARMYASSIAAIRFETSEGKGLKTIRVRIDNKIANPENSFWGHWKGQIWDDFSFFSHVPDLPKNAKLVVYLDYGSSLDIFVDNVAIEIWSIKK